MLVKNIKGTMRGIEGLSLLLPSLPKETVVDLIERLGLPGRGLGEEGLLVKLGALLGLEVVPVVMSTRHHKI